MERKYSVAEIDEMRGLVGQILTFGPGCKGGNVEDRLRTYMLNGTEPDELRGAAEDAIKAGQEYRMGQERMMLAQQMAQPAE